MPIKDFSQETRKDGDDWQGPWGSIAPAPHSVTTLGVVRSADGEERISYPYRSLARWSWKEGEPETLEILAGQDRIVVTGRGLKGLLDALDLEQLEEVRECSGHSDENSKICVQAIQIEGIQE